MRRCALLVAVVLIGVACPSPDEQQHPPPPPIVFVHGLGASAARVGVPGGQFPSLLPRLARDFPSTGVCQKDAQPGTPWAGSPCVFRYVEDRAEAGEPSPAGEGPNDSQSGVEGNAAKLADEVEEVAVNAGRRAVVIGYSMGGAIVRAYLGLHRDRAERSVAAAILIDAPTQGSWGFSLDVRRYIPNPLAAVVAEAVVRGLAARLAVDLDRPAFEDLRPRSDLYRRVAAMPVPTNVDYFTFWGDIRLRLRAEVLGRPVDTATLQVGDLAILPGDPDPGALPPLGGQRFSPDVAEGHVALDVPHTAELVLAADDVRALLGACTGFGNRDCAATLGRLFDVPDAHTAVQRREDDVMVNAERLGGRVSLEEATVSAIRSVSSGAGEER